MKKIIVLLGAFALIFGSCCSGSKAPKSEADSLAYAIGIDLGMYIKNVDSTLNVDMIASAIKDVIKNKQKIEQEEAYAYVREYFMVRKPALAKKASEDYLAGIEKKGNVQKTESGLLYEVIKPGNENKALFDTDTVQVVYHGTTKDGKVFDSSLERGDTATFTLNRVIKGWTEGMKLIGEGGKVKLWIPADLAYGEQGAGQMIGPNEAIVFDVDLVSVAPGPAPDAQQE